MIKNRRSIAAQSLLKAFVFFLLLLPFVSVDKQIYAETSQNVYLGPFIDVHEHYSLGTSGLGNWVSDEEVISQMDKAGIAKMVAFADETYISILKKYPDRIIPFYQFAAVTSMVGDNPLAINMVRQALDSGFIGIGELFFRHQSFRGIPADSLLAKQIADLAAERRVVISVHHEVSTSSHGQGMLAEFQRILDYRKSVKFIWAHGGYAQPADIRELLDSHTNLFIDLSGRTYAFGTEILGRPIADRDGLLFEEWRDLLERYPDRFIVGLDKQPNLHDQTFMLAESQFFRKMLGQLSPLTAEKVAFGNIQKLINIGKPTTITVNVPPSIGNVGSPIKISGRIKPAVNNITVSVSYTVDGQDVKVTFLKSSEDGSFSDILVPDRDGQWILKASTAGAIGYIGSESSWVLFTIKRRPDTVTTTDAITPSREVDGAVSAHQLWDLNMIAIIVAVSSVTALVGLKKFKKK